MVSVEDAIGVVVPGSPLPIFVHPIQQVGFRKFIKLAKGDHKIIRLLSSSSSPYERALTNTTIIEDLIDLRNKRRHELLNPPNSEKQEELGIDSASSCKRPKVSDMMLPEVVELKVPAIGSASATNMLVLLTKPGTPLSIEATSDNIEYLRAAIAEQISDTASPKVVSASADSTAPSEHIDIPSAGPGITFVKGRQAYRVRYQKKRPNQMEGFSGCFVRDT